MEDLRQSYRLLWFVLLVFVVSYALLFFPFAYFRHDDWLNLGNAVLRIPGNWLSLFSTTWIENGVEQVWFFRPFFKLSYFLGYHTFGYSYYGWLLATLLLTLLALFTGYKTIEMMNPSVKAPAFFVIFFAGNLHFHLGSLLWAGEGYMNVPSVLLLSISTYCFVRYMKRGYRLRWQLLSLFTFLLALGYKEASFAHVIFLAAVYFTMTGKFEWFPKPLILPVLLTACYLIIRLFVLPINPYYHPKLADGLRAFLYFLIAFLGPVLGLVIFFGKKWNQLFNLKYPATWFFLLFFLAVVLPHQGHPFFSPGWLLYPGFFISLYLAMAIREPESFNVKAGPWITIFLLSFVLVIGRMQSLDWWRWGLAQRQMHELLGSISPQRNESVRVRNCSPADLGPERILGYPGAISDWYEAIHGKRLNFSYTPCTTPVWHDPRVIWYDWKFPYLIKTIG